MIDIKALKLGDIVYYVTMDTIICSGGVQELSIINMDKYDFPNINDANATLRVGEVGGRASYRLGAEECYLTELEAINKVMGFLATERDKACDRSNEVERQIQALLKKIQVLVKGG